VGIWLATAGWEANKPLPPGVRTESTWYSVPAQDVSFIADVTSADAYGRSVSSQAIFDQVLTVVRSAREFLVLDYFLFNSQRGDLDAKSPPLRPISGELRDALIQRRRELPGLKVLFITDPVNELYGAQPSPDLRLLRAAGVDVVVTDLQRLRDSNLIYSSLWRLVMAWWSTDARGEGWLPNPLDDGASPITFGAWAHVVNFKANQRKVVIGDDGHGGLVGIVASANPHDASSAHSNVAAKITGPALSTLLESELAVARFSGWSGNIDPPTTRPEAAQAPASADNDIAAGRAAGVKVLTEGAIRAALLGRVDATVRGDSVDVAMFYLADRSVIESLLAASKRAVNVRLILDPNEDSFGHTKSGIPNQPVASELVSASDGAIHVRWYRTHGEQFHTKLVLVYGPERLWLTLGSADLTRRDIGDYNLEANLAIEVARGSQLALQTLEYFDTLWSNRASLGIEYTADFAAYADPAQSHYWLYRFMEGTGLSAF
jgi:hypothetical protein